MTIKLFVGNKNYSSWSLRAWLCLRWSGLQFEEQLIRLDQPGYGKGQVAEWLAVTPTGIAPALHSNDWVIWDSLAIAEWVNEQPSSALHWPVDSAMRAHARSVVCEMHSGFAGLRRDLSMNIHRRVAAQPWPEDTFHNLNRIDAMWQGLRQRYAAHGPYLFGERCVADAFFLPVATRLRTYGVALSATSNAYRDFILADEDFKHWEGQSIPNSWDSSGLSVIDGLYL